MTELTILTPVYNRAKLLKNCYASLLAQTCFDFEWVVVNDGSTDGTGALMRELIAAQQPFPIQYIEKENGGKHTALNAAHPYIHGKYVLILDSDDTLTEDAVEQALQAWSAWEKSPEIGLVILLRGKDREHSLCYAEAENTPVDIMSYPRVCPISGDACEVIRTELLRQFPFPVFPGERFIGEGALWGRLSFTHKCVYVNRVICICEYLEGGLTDAGRAMRIRNPRGGMFHANVYMARKNGLKTQIKNGLLYTAYGCFARLSPRQMAAQSDHKALVCLCLPWGRLLYHIWKKKYTGSTP